MDAVFMGYIYMMLFLGPIAVPLSFLQIYLPVRLFFAIKAYKRSKKENRADKGAFGVILGGCMAALAVWFPLLISLYRDMNAGFNPYFSIIRSRFFGGVSVIPTIVLVLLSAFAVYRIGKGQRPLRKISFWVYAVCEFILTYFEPEMLWESVLGTVGGIALSVWLGALTAALCVRIKKKRSEKSEFRVESEEWR